jgi:thioesterase domain-containing protein/acyl carrier protein
MVPMAYVTLEAFPLTPNGKLDRQKLPAPDRTRFESDTSMITPKDTLELQLTAIWQEVLDVCPIGVRDNFFELGGHSLLAVRLFARIEHAIGKPLPLALLFQAPTVEQMASYIRQEGGFVPRTSLVPIQPHGTGRPFFCVHPGAGSVLGFTLLGKYLAPNQPFYGIEARGLYGDVPCLDRIEVMADTYLHDLRAIQPEGPYMLGGRCFGGLVALEMAQQLRAQGEQIALLVIFDTLRLLNVEDELRASLLDVDSISPKPVKSPEERLATRRGRKVRFKQQAKRLGSTYKRMRAVWQACEQARNAYAPKPYPGRITLFRDGPATPIPAHEARWTALAEHGVERHLMPGNHHTLFQEPHVQVLAERLKLLIATA